MKNKSEQRLVLASASPRRLDLLSQIGITPDAVIPADIDESEFAREHPRDVCVRLALGKARKVAESEKGAFILGADTVVACGRRTLPKGETREDVTSCLERLSGRRHRIYGGICIIAPDGREVTRCVQTMVHFKPLSADEINFYAKSGEGEGKAGAYGIQGLASAFVKKIEGSYSNIVGLSCYDTLAMLTGLGYTRKASHGTPENI